MHDRFEVPARGRVGKYERGQLGSAQRAVLLDHIRTETIGNGRERRSPRRHDVPCQMVGIHDGHAGGAEPLRDVALASADPAGQRHAQHLTPTIHLR